MTRVLMHKMSGHKDWNNTRNVQSGLHYFSSLEQDEKTVDRTQHSSRQAEDLYLSSRLS